MTSEKELDKLIKDATEKLFAKVSRKMDENGYTEYVHVYGVKGIGPGPMPPIAAAERLREVLANYNHKETHNA